MTKTCLLSQCVRLGALQKAEEVYQDVKHMEGGQVDANVYSMMLSAYLDAGREEEAARVVEEAYGFRTGRSQMRHGTHLKADKIEHVLRALKRKGVYDEVAVPLIRGLLKAGCPLPSRVTKM